MNFILKEFLKKNHILLSSLYYSGDKRKQPIDRKGNSDSDSSKRGSREDNRNKDDRDRSRDRKSTGNQGNRSHRDGDNSDNIARFSFMFCI